MQSKTGCYTIEKLPEGGYIVISPEYGPRISQALFASTKLKRCLRFIADKFEPDRNLEPPNETP